ncbi:MAG: fumarylacetoacetate hydrolase family protein [Bermanella sp.]
MRKIIIIPITLLLAAAAFLANALFQPFFEFPQPANIDCLDMQQGSYVDFQPEPKTIFAFGLNYSKHIKEGMGLYDPDKPLVFFKHLQTLNDSPIVKTPTSSDLMDEFEKADPELAAHISQNYNDIPALLDYEVEVGYVLLEDVDVSKLNDSGYVPQIGYFLVNEFTSRTPLVMAGAEDRVPAFNAAKGFPGFLTYAKQYWVPNKSQANSGICVQLTTEVNGEIRQNSNSRDLIRSPKGIIQAVAKLYPDKSMLKGDLVLTGTPEGVSLSIPVWKQNLVKMVKPSSSMKFDAFIGLDKTRFLKAGDKVVVKAEGLGEVENLIQ